MDLNEKKVYEDFDTIRKTLEQTKKDYNGLSVILFRYGLVQLILITLTIILGNVFRYFGNLGGFVRISVGLNILAAVYMTVFFLKIYHSENMTSNKYYLSCIGMWGIITIALPFINFAIRGIIIVLDIDNANYYLLIKEQDHSLLINMLLFCFCMIICGFITEKKGCIVASLLILFVFLDLNILYFNTNISKIGTSVFTIFYYACITIGYIGLSYMLRWRSKHGNK